MRILVTGSNGLTGHAITRQALLHPDIELINTSSRPEKDTSIYKFELLDINHQEKFAYLLDLYKPDCLINTAAISQIDRCESNKALCHQINFNAVLQMSETCSIRNIHFIHISSDFVFDGLNQKAYTETDRIGPVNYYGECKSLTENLLTERGNNICIVRTALVYDYPENIKRNNIFRWIYDSLKTNKSISVVDDQFRTPTFVDDLAKALILLAREKKEGIFHIAGSEKLSVIEFAQKISNHFNFDTSLIKPSSSIALNQRATRPQKTYLDISKARAELNYLPHNITSAFEVIKARI